MAFQAMMGGAECSTSNNPLSSLLKQQQADHSLHHQPFTPAGSAHHHAQGSSMRSMTPTIGQLNGDEADRFFHAGPSGGPLQLDGMRRELENVARGTQPAIKGDREWASQYQPAGANLSPADMARMEEQFRMQQQSSHPTNFAAEFAQHRHFSPGPSAGGQTYSNAPPPASASASLFARPGFAPSYGSFMGMGPSMSSGMYQPPVAHQHDAVQADSKGKGRFVELDDKDWEEHFAKAGKVAEDAPKVAKTEAEGESGQTTKDLLDEGEIPLDATESDHQLMRDLEATWSSLKDQLNTSANSDAELAQWEAQYGSQFNDLHGSDLFDDETDIDQGFGIPDLRQGKQWTRDNVDSFLSDESPFPYSEENQFMSSQDPYAEGMRLLAEGAPLSEAALAFEAACRKDETRAEAWKAAGETWAADEREAKGIRALEKAVACGGPEGVSAWMSLAVAYVNEGQEMRALATLEKWISLAYPSIALPPAPMTSMRNPWESSNRVIDLFLAAAQAGPQSRAQDQADPNAIVDPEVQVGLGVLFYSNSDYERAKDCFEAALSVRPDDFLLWNRLGATLANGGLPEEAISAYRKALELRPTFTRATYNLGVSCLNIGCYHEAAEHLLAALQGQMSRDALARSSNSKGKGKAGDEDDGRIPGSTRPIGEADDGSANLWHTLRRAFLCMERHDLADRAFPGADVDSFRAEGFEF